MQTIAKLKVTSSKKYVTDNERIIQDFNATMQVRLHTQTSSVTSNEAVLKSENFNNQNDIKIIL
jgi:hypothetical protein